MAKPSSSQQSSQLKKLALIGVGLVVIVLVAFPSGSPSSSSSTGGSKVNLSSGPGKGSTKKVDPYHLPEDDKAQEEKFERIPATIKNGFVPGVGKGDGNLEAGTIPGSFTGGESSWTYTGNMVVDGVANALLENSSTGDGVFLRPGQSWKNCRLVAVKDDSIELEGPGGLRKTVFFNDKTLSAPSPSTTLQSLPPASIQGNIPNNNGMNPQFGQPGGRRQRGPQADQTGGDALYGPIGADNLTSNLEAQDLNNNSNTSGNNRRIGRNQ